MIVACGEAIVDLVPETDGAGAVLFRPVLGGSLFNVALGLARLGGRAAFLWEASTDQFGPLFREALAGAGADLTLLRTTDRASPVAVVDLSSGEPAYRIADPDRVMATFDPGPAPGGPGCWTERAACFHTGSAILALEPLGSRLEALATGIAPRVPVSVDFNVRPPSVSDWDAYRERLARLEGCAAILKASAVDLAHLHGRRPAEAHLDRWLAAGAALGVVTLAEEGVVAATPAARVALPALPVDLVDPVGAGDAFMAGLLAFLDREGLMSRDRLAGLEEDTLRAALSAGRRAAAWCCRHQGGRMPFGADLAAMEDAAA